MHSCPNDFSRFFFLPFGAASELFKELSWESDFSSSSSSSCFSTGVAGEC